MEEQEKIFAWRDSEGDAEDFEAIVPSLVEGGWLTRDTLDEVRDDLRPIAEAELTRQDK